MAVACVGHWKAMQGMLKRVAKPFAARICRKAFHHWYSAEGMHDMEISALTVPDLTQQTYGAMIMMCAADSWHGRCLTTNTLYRGWLSAKRWMSSC
mmetsp:Transcript_40126/g.79347  ORF Transcript_40126/g.79347 Transcript_40126/m.79347 type:complete len:96 (+) Transcript_40126:329-616(+)